jgi:hypothetical protein
VWCSVTEIGYRHLSCGWKRVPEPVVIALVDLASVSSLPEE